MILKFYIWRIEKKIKLVQNERTSLKIFNYFLTGKNFNYYIYKT